VTDKPTNYWKQRALLAEKVIHLTPCTKLGIKADNAKREWNKYLMNN